MRQIAFSLIASVSILVGCGSADDARRELFVESDVAPLGSMSQAIEARGFYGWRAESVDQRGRLCAEVVAADGDQICFLPASTAVKWYVDPAGFSTADYNELRQQSQLHTGELNEYLPPLGWTYAEATAATYNVRLKAGPVNHFAYTDTHDVRRWLLVSCDAASGNLDEPVPLVGRWRRCGAITVTVDIPEMLVGCSSCRQTRLRQAAGVAIAAWGSGLGIGNILPHTVFQRTTVDLEWLSVIPSDRDACALDLYALGSKTEIRKLPSDACDGWTWH